MTHLLVTVRFLDDRYHGLLDRGGPPEWPPSPFRLFQAMVAGLARRGELVDGDDICLCVACKDDRRNRALDVSAEPEQPVLKPMGNALAWLQRLISDCPPIIIAPPSKPGRAISRFVPNNDGDKIPDRQNRLTGKHTQPTLFLLEEGQKPEVHYVWPINRVDAVPIDHVRDAARSLTALGWGIDMAFADALLIDEAALQKLAGIRWHPKKNVGSIQGTLRVPTYDHEAGECTLCDLRHCHSTFINRIEHGRPLKTVDKPKVFERVLYASAERSRGRPQVVFQLLDSNDDIYMYPHAKLIHLAGMVRHLSIEAMRRNPPRGVREPDRWRDKYVAGHRKKTEAAVEAPHAQLSYVPLPSVGHAHTDPGVRRVMIVAPLGDDEILEHLARQLDGRRLVPERTEQLRGPVSLSRVRHDGVINRYTKPCRTWASFTPVILPGHDDRKPEKTRKLIRKALDQSGIDQPCEFEWGAFSLFAKSYSAHKYVRNEQAKDGRRPVGYIRPGHLLELSAVHLRLTFEYPVPGPVTIGAGRHCGFGLMAGLKEQDKSIQ